MDRPRRKPRQKHRQLPTAERTAEGVVEPTAESTEESATHTTPAAAALPPEWDQLLNEWISPDSAYCDAPGGVLLVDSPDGRFVQAAGVASLDDQRPLAINDRFRDRQHH